MFKYLMLSAALLVATPVFPQVSSSCAPRDKIVEGLAEKYGEARQSVAMGTKNRVIEVFASKETGSWTITVTTPDGMTCLVASGQRYEAINEEIKPKGDDL